MVVLALTAENLAISLVNVPMDQVLLVEEIPLLLLVQDGEGIDSDKLQDLVLEIEGDMEVKVADLFPATVAERMVILLRTVPTKSRLATTAANQDTLSAIALSHVWSEMLEFRNAILAEDRVILLVIARIHLLQVATSVDRLDILLETALSNLFFFV